MAANLAGALLRAQGDFPQIPKNARGQTGNQRYTYADLPSIRDVCGPILRSHGLVLNELSSVETLHVRLQYPSTGEIEETVAPIPAGLWQHPKQLGAYLTYMTRYLIMGLLGISPDDDISERDEVQPRRLQRRRVEEPPEDQYEPADEGPDDRGEPPDDERGIPGLRQQQGRKPGLREIAEKLKEAEDRNELSRIWAEHVVPLPERNRKRLKPYHDARLRDLDDQEAEEASEEE